MIGSYAYSSIETWMLYALFAYTTLCFIIARTGKVRMLIFIAMIFCGGMLRTTVEMKTIEKATDAHTRSSILYQSRHHSTLHLERFSEPIRNKLLNTYKEAGIENEHFAIISAMTLGYRDAITTDIRNAYSRSGAAHILALSGMHIAIIYGIFLFIIKRLLYLIYFIPDFIISKRGIGTFTRWFLRCRPSTIFILNSSLTAAILITWCYVFLTGMPMSAIRAALMLTIYGILKITNIKASTEEILYVTAFFILLFMPLALYDVGFQMSFAAVLGIAKFSVPLNKHFSRHILKRKTDQALKLKKQGKRWKIVMINLSLSTAIWVLVCLSISLSAQITVLPLTAHYFGIVSCYSLLSSIFVSLAATFILCSGLFLLLVSALPLPYLITKVTAWALTTTINLQNSLLDTIVALSGAYIENIDISTWQTILLYTMIWSTYRIARLMIK